jgi:hypothetical protein
MRKEKRLDHEPKRREGEERKGGGIVTKREGRGKGLCVVMCRDELLSHDRRLDDKGEDRQQLNFTNGPPSSSDSPLFSLAL